jgi:hypothetical protein
MFTLTCPECKREFSHEKEPVVKRMLGHHRSNTHGFQTPHARAQWLLRHPGQTPPGPRKGMAGVEVAPVVALDQKREAMREYQRRYRARKRLKKAADNPAVQAYYNQVDRESLQQSSWWKGESQAPKPITCPCCSAQFVIIAEGK